MTLAAPSVASGITTNRAVVVSGLSRPGRVERAVAALTLFFLAFGLPSDWTVVLVAGQAVEGEGGSSIIAVFLLLAGALAAFLVGNYRVVNRAIWREPLVALMTFLVIASTVWATVPEETLRRSISVALSTFVGYYLVTRYTLLEILKLVGFVLLVGTALNLLWVYALPEYGIMGQANFEQAGDWDGILPHRNSLGRMTAMSVLTFLVLFRADRRWRLFYVLGLVGNIVLMLGTGSKTAFASTALAFGLLIVYSMFRARKTLYGAVAISLIAALVLAVLFVTANLAAVTDFLDRDVTLTGRTDLWADSITAGGEKPMLGYGWDGFWTGWFGPSGEIYHVHRWLPPHAHNFFIDVYLQLGLVGLVVWSYMLIRGVIHSSRFVRASNSAAGLWPLTYLSLVFVWCITESNLIGRNIYWVLIVVALVTVGDMRKPVKYIPPVQRNLPVPRPLPPQGQPAAGGLRVLPGGAQR